MKIWLYLKHFPADGLALIGGTAKATNAGELVAATLAMVAAGLGRLIQRRDEWPQMAQRGRQAVLDHLEWRNVARQALADYERL